MERNRRKTKQVNSTLFSTHFRSAKSLQACAFESLRYLSEMLCIRTFLAFSAVLALTDVAVACDRNRTICNIERVENDIDLILLRIPTVTDDLDWVKPYYDRAGKVVRLATSDTLKGRLWHNRKPENFDEVDYKIALKEYQSVHDCLVEAEQNEERPDLTRFDWSGLPNHGAAYVCFLMVFTSYENASDVLWWLAKQKMYIQRRYSKYQLPRSAEDRSDRKSSKDYGVRLAGGYASLPYGGTKYYWPFSAFENEGYTLSVSFANSHGLVALDIIAHRTK